jgi:osmotically-inducible protein OsmY
MKSRIPLYVSVLVAAGSVSLAAAQGTRTAQQQPNAQSQPANAQPQSPSMRFVQEPIATATKAQGADAELADSIVKALDADPAMKDSKITVQPDNGTVFLTGATLTRAQKKRAGEIAIAQAGQDKVVNVILDDET